MFTDNGDDAGALDATRANGHRPVASASNVWEDRMLRVGSFFIIIVMAVTGGCDSISEPAVASTTGYLAGGDRLNAGERLYANQSISSGSTRLVYQGDNNLVLYQDDVALWATMAGIGQPAGRFEMQRDCNAVVYSSIGFAWASWSNGLGSSCYAKVIDGDWFICSGTTRVFSARGGGYCRTTWYFPEGGETIGGLPDYHDFQTYYHFANANSFGVSVAAHFQGDAGSWDTSFALQANSRTSISFHDLAGGRRGFHAAEFYSMTAGAEIQVSSTMLNNSFEGHLWEASKAIAGASEPHTQWAFGEGGIYSVVAANTPAFDHVYAIYNPNPGPSNLSVKFYPDEHDNPRSNPIPFWLGQVPGRSRMTFNPFGWSPNLRAESAIISCTPACVAQMTMYQRSNGRHPNTQSALGSQLARNWYVVNIPTGASWEPRIYLFNPSPMPNVITLHYRNAAGVELVNPPTTYTMEPETRISYALALVRDPRVTIPLAPLGYDGGNLWLEIDAQYPIALTKIVYWAAETNGVSWNEGASTTGHSRGGPKVVVPGGNTGGGFNNYLHVVNVGTVATNLWMTTYRPSGIPMIGKRWVGYLNPKGMVMFDGGAYINPAGDFATVLETDYQTGQALIAESANYFDWTGSPNLWRSGDAVEGIVYAGVTPTQP